MEQQSIRHEMEMEDDMEAAEEAAGYSNAIVLAPTPSVPAAVDDEVTNEKQFQDLIKDFRSEPADDAAAAAKFKLYESFAETVAASRKDTLEFWQSCKKDFEGTGNGAAAKAVQRQVNNIDRSENLAINFDAAEWFVCTMTRQASRNEKLIQSVLRSIQTKLELLSTDAECPICLESIEDSDADAVVLGCCHRVCAECWTHWKAMRGGGAFCPLCRYSDFITELSTISGVTPANAQPTPVAAPAPAAPPPPTGAPAPPAPPVAPADPSTSPPVDP